MKKKTAALLAAVPLTGAALFTEELYRYMFCRKPSALFCRLFDSKGHEEGYYTWRAELEQRQRELPCEEYTIPSARGEKLKGYYYPAGGEGKRIAFALHGYRADHLGAAGLCDAYYRSRGIDVFACDHTASGASGGQYIGFDVLEAEDALLWVDFLVEKFGPEVELILHGFSMGAATVLQMSSRCPTNVRFLVEDSGFACARASLAHQIGPMYQPMRLVNRLAAGYDLDDSDVTASLAEAKLPILFVHGQEDQLVPFANGPSLYRHYRGEKDYFFPEHTRHIESFYTCPEEYGRKLDAFAEKYL